MRKFLLAIAALFFSAGAHAHVLAVPFPEVGSLRDVAHQAAFFMPQTYLPSAIPRGDVICDLTTGVATGVGAGTCVAQPAACNGDISQVTRTVTITSGTGGNKYLNTSTNTFNIATDAGKTIIIPGAGSGNDPYTGTIASVTDTQNVVLTTAVSTVLTSVPTYLQYGTNDAQALADFMTWANLTWQASFSGLVEQYIPSGKSCQVLSQVTLTASSFDSGCASGTYPFTCSWNSSGWAKGIRKFLMNFAGASITNYAAKSNAKSATVAVAGSGYTNGAQTLTVTSGTCDVYPQFSVTVVGNVLTGAATLVTPGMCTGSTNDGNNQSTVSGGGGTGGKLNVSYSSGITFVANAGDGVCHNGLASTKGCSARTANAIVGDQQVTLLDTSLCGRFTVGNYAIMTGFATQSLYSAASAFGYPPNFQFFDHVKVTSLANCATGLANGTVNIDRPLTNNYKSTWPNNAPGTTGEADQGGPATLYALPFWWDSEVEYRGGTMDNRPNQTNGAGRSTVYRNFTWLGSACAYPTIAISWTVIGGNWSTCDVEMDKMVTTATFTTYTGSKLNFQSSSPRYTIIDSSSIAIMNGGGRNTTITNTAFTSSSADTFFAGPSGFGAADSFNCTNCTIASSNGIGAHGANETGTVTAGNWSISGQSGGPYTATMTNGIITVPNTHGAVTWAAPGSNFVWEFTAGTRYVYQILDITQDPTNQYVTTNCVGVNTVCGVGGGFPVASGSLKIRSHPAPKFNCTNCTGSTLVTALSNGPTDVPLYSYANYTVDVSWPIGSTSFVTLWGAFSTITLNVTNPYAGAGALGFNFIYQFGGPTSQVMAKDGTTTNYQPSLDLKTGGLRTITPSGVVGGGGADNLALPITSAWYGNQTQPNITAHPAWAGTAQITIQTDQGVVP